MGCAIALAQKSNVKGIQIIIRCIHRANENDKWLIAGCSKVLPMLHSFVIEFLLASGTHLTFQHETKLSKLNISNRFNQDDCITTSAQLLELSISYCDVEWKSSEEHLSNLGLLVCQILFQSRPNSANNNSFETEYALDSLHRNASFVLCNVLETFPEMVNRMFTELKKARHELLRLIIDTHEASTQRSLIRVARLLYGFRAKDKFLFPEFRCSMAAYLRKNIKPKTNSARALKLFRQISLSHDDSSIQVEKYRETLSVLLDTNKCFTTGDCKISIYDASYEIEMSFEDSSVDWDDNSFALRMPSVLPIRIPWYRVKQSEWDASGKVAKLEVLHVARKVIEIKFNSSANVRGTMAYRVCCRMQERISTAASNDIDLEDSLQTRKVSQAFVSSSDCLNFLPVTDLKHTAVPEKRTVFSELAGDGTLLQDGSPDNRMNQVGIMDPVPMTVEKVVERKEKQEAPRNAEQKPEDMANTMHLLESEVSGPRNTSPVRMHGAIPEEESIVRRVEQLQSHAQQNIVVCDPEPQLFCMPLSPVRCNSLPKTETNQQVYRVPYQSGVEPNSPFKSKSIAPHSRKISNVIPSAHPHTMIQKAPRDPRVRNVSLRGVQLPACEFATLFPTQSSTVLDTHESAADVQFESKKSTLFHTELPDIMKMSSLSTPCRDEHQAINSRDAEGIQLFVNLCKLVENAIKVCHA